jgi:hypothetical protein
MNMNVERTSTRFYVTQFDYESLLNNSKTDLIIHCSPKRNKHPSGKYIISNLVARRFIESKQNTHNWDNHKNFIQDSVPKGLENYFTMSKS